MNLDPDLVQAIIIYEGLREQDERKAHMAQGAYLTREDIANLGPAARAQLEAQGYVVEDVKVETKPVKEPAKANARTTFAMDFTPAKPNYWLLFAGCLVVALGAPVWCVGFASMHTARLFQADTKPRVYTYEIGRLILNGGASIMQGGRSINRYALRRS